MSKISSWDQLEKFRNLNRWNKTFRALMVLWKRGRNTPPVRVGIKAPVPKARKVRPKCPRNCHSGLGSESLRPWNEFRVTSIGYFSLIFFSSWDFGFSWTPFGISKVWLGSMEMNNRIRKVFYLRDIKCHCMIFNIRIFKRDFLWISMS